MLGDLWKLKNADKHMLDCIQIGEQLSLDQIADERRLLTGRYCDVDVVKDLFDAKNYIGENYNAYTRFRMKVMPNKHQFQGVKYKYHTFIKLIQAFELTAVKCEEINSFYDVCGGPGEWVRSLLKHCPKVEKGYCISLNDKSGGLPFDKDIFSNPKIVVISKDDGNIYNINNYEESKKIVDKVELLTADGGFDVYSMGIDENLQSLVVSHLIFCEFVYGISFLKNNGILVVKLFDCFDELTAQLIMLASCLFEETYITKPEESRLVNSERYLVCKNYCENVNVTDKLVDLLKKCENDYYPTTLFKTEDIEKYANEFVVSLKQSNEEFAKKQADFIRDVVKKCVDMKHKQYKK